MRELRYARHRRLRPPGDRPHGVGSGRDRPLPARLEWLDPRDQGAAGGRRRAPAARGDPRGDRRVLRCQRAAGADRRDESRHRSRPDPGRDPSPPAAAASRGRREPARARRGAAEPAARTREPRSSSCSRRGRERRRQISAVASEPCASTTRSASRAQWSGGPWLLEADRPDLAVRARRPGDHLAGRRKKVQDLLVDAKVPRAERDDWPVVVSGEDEVVAVPGIAVAPGWEGAVTVRRAGR